MKLYEIGIGCLIIRVGLSSLSFNEVKDNFKIILEKPSKLVKIGLFFTIFEYVTEIFLFGIILMLIGVTAIILNFYDFGLFN